MTVTINGTTGYSGPVGTIGDLTTTGNTTLGDASSDTLTLNGNTASIPNGLNFTNGNIGIGVTPSAWTAYKALQVNTVGVLAATTGQTAIGNNWYYNSGDKYLTTAASSLYVQQVGRHEWYYAASGTAGAAITFTQAMTLDASGNLGIGTTSPGYKLQVSSGTGAYTDIAVFKTAEATNSSNAGGGFSAIPSATAGSRVAYVWLDADGGNFSGSDYFYIQKTGNSGQADLVQSSNSPMTFKISSSEVARFDTGGNFLVAATSPSAMAGVPGIQVGSSGSTFAGVGYQNANRAYVQFVGTGGYDNAFITFDTTGNAERARITTGGFAKFTNSASYYSATGSYHEFTSSTSNQNALIIRSSNTSPYGPWFYFNGASPNNTTNYFLVGSDTTNDKFYIYSSGTFGSRTSTYGGISDIKVKQDVVDASSQWNDIKGLRFRKYRFKDDPTGPLQLGLISQEAELVSPGLVFETPDTKRDAEGNVVETGEVTKHVKYSIVYMKAVVALQEAMNRIEQLEADFSAYKLTHP